MQVIASLTIKSLLRRRPVKCLPLPSGMQRRDARMRVGSKVCKADGQPAHNA